MKKITAGGLVLLVFAATLSAPAPGVAQDSLPQFFRYFKLRPPQITLLEDSPDDNGGSVYIRWRLSPDDNLWGKRGLVEKYVVMRTSASQPGYEYVGSPTFHNTSLYDNSTRDNERYRYYVAAYPFKQIFEPLPWKTVVTASLIDKLRLLSPWIPTHLPAVLVSTCSRGFAWNRKLQALGPDLALKSIWENVRPSHGFDGPAGLAPHWIFWQQLSPAAGFFHFAALSARSSDPYQLATLDRLFETDLESAGASPVAGPVHSSKQWFYASRLNMLVATLVLCFLILYFIAQARSGKTLFIRKIAGLEAVDDAVGRATEMGKAIFYIPGTQDMDNVQTIAGVTILGRVARLAAQYETKLEVPVSRSLVMITAREIVKEAYLNSGRPDAYNEDMIYYLTDDQFGYAAAIDGKVVREKPATMFYMGAFYAEALILAETGNSIGAVQIAGTAMPTQLPFFVAACDYTLIGEELFAASAYLSREPRLLGALKGQDIGKGLILVALLIGVILQTFGWYDFAGLFVN